MSYARLVLSTSAKEEMPTFAINSLPQRHVTTSLAEHYLENVHSLYPFLSETKIFAAIDAVYQNNGRYASPTDHWTTRMVLAIACCSMSRKRGDTHYQDAVRHVVGALENIESVVHPGSVSGIQAMLLLVLYGMLDPHHFNSWYLVGLASRAMVDIGMHQDPPKEFKLKDVDQELRKHVFASIYALDRSVGSRSTPEHSAHDPCRSISMVYRRGFSFTDDSAEVTNPLLLPPQNSPSGGRKVFLHSLDAAIQLNRLRQIQSSAYQRLFQSDRPTFESTWSLMTSALNDMHCWSKSLPENLSEQQMKLFWNLFRSNTLYSSILILSPDLEGTLCDYGKFLIFEYAVEYADIVASMSVDSKRFAFLTYYDALAVTFVGDRLIRMLYTDSAVLFSNTIAQAPPTSIPRNGPSIIPARTVGERVNRAHRCLTQIERTLGQLGPRFGYPEPLNEFKAQSSGIRHLLQNTYDRWNRSLGASRSQYVSTGPSQNWSQR